MFETNDIDPINKFKQLRGPGAQVSVQRADLVAALEGKSPDEDLTPIVTDFLTKNTSLTESTAKPLAAAAAAEGKAAGGDVASKTADSVLGKLSELDGTAGDSLELSDPVMLWPWARMIGALLFIGAGIVSAVFIFYRNRADTGYNVPLTVVAVAALLAALILIMGYKNVTISKGSSSGSGSSGSKDQG